MRSTFLVLAALLACACNQNGAALAAPQPGAPCGVGKVCVDENGPTGMCCWQGSVCGGPPPNVGCPAGQCCEEDGFEMHAGTDAGPWMRPQYPARR